MRAVTCFIACTIIGINFHLISTVARDVKSKVTQTKNIVIWNSQHRVDSGVFFVREPEPFKAKGCPVTDCRIVRNYKDLPFDFYDAVVFNMLDYEEIDFPEELGLKRRDHQRYVFLTQEAPPLLWLTVSSFDGYFNWTMSFTDYSDIKLIYGKIKPKSSAPREDSEVRRLIDETHHWPRNYLANKTKSVAWMVSNCYTDSLRETYVEELSKYIDVDIYGKCGNLTCAHKFTDWLSHSECYDVLANNYKFYLSFENALCRDYASEKFFLPLIHDIVPVVYGGANYTALAPPHSFIDALQFTPRQLARYLHRVGSNKTLYNEFFWWKDHYEVEAETYQMLLHAYCDLCKKLHEDDRPKIYPNITTLWDAYAQCMSIDPWNIRSIIPSNWFL